MIEYNKKITEYIKEELSEIRKASELISAKKEVIDGLVKTPISALYIIRRVPTVLPKCDKCNKDGLISFLSPQGKEHKEKCLCNKEVKVRKPVKLELAGIYWEEGIPVVWFREGEKIHSTPYHDIKLHTEENDYSSCSPEAFFFKEFKDCERWCNILNVGIF